MLATSQVLNSHMWLVATVLDSEILDGAAIKRQNLNIFQPGSLNVWVEQISLRISDEQ